MRGFKNPAAPTKLLIYLTLAVKLVRVSYAAKRYTEGQAPCLLHPLQVERKGLCEVAEFKSQLLKRRFHLGKPKPRSVCSISL